MRAAFNLTWAQRQHQPPQAASVLYFAQSTVECAPVGQWFSGLRFVRRLNRTTVERYECLMHQGAPW